MSRAEPLATLLEEVVGSPEPREVIARRFRSGERFVGFGSPMYGSIDPRAEYLLPLLKAKLGSDPAFNAFSEACLEVEELTGLRPGLTVIAAYIGRMLGFRGAQQISCLLLGRSSGWIANAMEQYFSTDLVRPRAAYVGALPDSQGKPVKR
jgi:citrate synthase